MAGTVGDALIDSSGDRPRAPGRAKRGRDAVVKSVETWKVNVGWLTRGGNSRREVAASVSVEVRSHDLVVSGSASGDRVAAIDIRYPGLRE